MDAGIPILSVSDLVPERCAVDRDDLHVDADLMEACLHDLCGLLKVGVCPSHDFELTPVVIGLSEIFLCLVKIIGVAVIGAGGGSAGPGLVTEDVRGVGLAVEDCLIDGFLVNAILDSLAEVGVVAGPAGLEEVILEVAALKAEGGVPLNVRGSGCSRARQAGG